MRYLARGFLGCLFPSHDNTLCYFACMLPPLEGVHCACVCCVTFGFYLLEQHIIFHPTQHDPCSNGNVRLILASPGRTLKDSSSLSLKKSKKKKKHKHRDRDVRKSSTVSCTNGLRGTASSLVSFIRSQSNGYDDDYSVMSSRVSSCAWSCS